MAYEVYYWGACGEFYGRALSPLLARDLVVHGGRRRERAAGRPRRVVEQDAKNESRGRPEGQGEEAHARRAQQGLVSIIH